jgi:hypothetical protein
MRKRSGGHSQMMQLTKFRNLIAVMPVEYQASTSKRSTWAKHMDSGNKEARDALRSVLEAFGTREDKVKLSRRDLRGLAQKQNLAQFVMATVVWGYTSGGRGNNVENLMYNLDHLTGLLSEARTQTVAEWIDHYKKVKKIGGVGLSTYTKFLNFLSVKVHGYAALILDDRIIQVANQDIFKELDPLRGLSNSNRVSRYPSYLKEMHSVAKSLEVSSEALEFFLFEFGPNLKSSSSR